MARAPMARGPCRHVSHFVVAVAVVACLLSPCLAVDYSTRVVDWFRVGMGTVERTTSVVAPDGSASAVLLVPDAGASTQPAVRMDADGFAPGSAYSFATHVRVVDGAATHVNVAVATDTATTTALAMVTGLAATTNTSLLTGDGTVELLASDGGWWTLVLSLVVDAPEASLTLSPGGPLYMWGTSVSQGVTCGEVHTTAETACTRGLSHGSVCRFSCAEGHLLTSPVTESTCRGNGQWSAAFPGCTPVECGPFQAPVDGVIKYLGNGTEYGAAVSVTCTRANTEAFPAAVATCLASGQWGPSIQCVSHTCTPFTLEDSTSGEVVCDSPYVAPGTRCWLVCAAGYHRFGGDHKTCQEDGAWHGAAMRCTETVWYTLNEVPATYSAAKGECASGGGRLAEFSTFAQFQHYLSVFPPTYQHQRVTSWIGWRVQPGGEWGWDSGMAPGIFASPRYAGELPGHDSDISFDPDGTLGALYFSTSRWNNNVPTIAKQDGSTVLPYVCIRPTCSVLGASRVPPTNRWFMMWFASGQLETQIGGAMAPSTSFQRWCMNAAASPMAAGLGSMTCDAASGTWIHTPPMDMFACVATYREVAWASSFGPTDQDSERVLATSPDGDRLYVVGVSIGGPTLVLGRSSSQPLSPGTSAPAASKTRVPYLAVVDTATGTVTTAVVIDDVVMESTLADSSIASAAGVRHHECAISSACVSAVFGAVGGGQRDTFIRPSTGPAVNLQGLHGAPDRFYWPLVGALHQDGSLAWTALFASDNEFGGFDPFPVSGVAVANAIPASGSSVGGYATPVVAFGATAFSRLNLWLSGVSAQQLGLAPGIALDESFAMTGYMLVGALSSVDGAYKWHQTIGATLTVTCSGVAVQDSGELVVARGFTLANGLFYFDRNGDPETVSFGSVLPRALLVGMDGAQGAVLWVTRVRVAGVGSTPSAVTIADTVVTEAGDVYAVGHFTGNAVFGDGGSTELPRDGTVTWTGDAAPTGFVMRVNGATGELEFVLAIPGSDFLTPDVEARGIAYDPYTRTLVVSGSGSAVFDSVVSRRAAGQEQLFDSGCSKTGGWVASLDATDGQVLRYECHEAAPSPGAMAAAGANFFVGYPAAASPFDIMLDSTAVPGTASASPTAVVVAEHITGRSTPLLLGFSLTPATVSDDLLPELCVSCSLPTCGGITYTFQVSGFQKAAGAIATGSNCVSLDLTSDWVTVDSDPFRQQVFSITFQDTAFNTLTYAWRPKPRVTSLSAIGLDGSTYLPIKLDGSPGRLVPVALSPAPMFVAAWALQGSADGGATWSSGGSLILAEADATSGVRVTLLAVPILVPAGPPVPVLVRLTDTFGNIVERSLTVQRTSVAGVDLVAYTHCSGAACNTTVPLDSQLAIVMQLDYSGWRYVLTDGRHSVERIEAVAAIEDGGAARFPCTNWQVWATSLDESFLDGEAYADRMARWNQAGEKHHVFGTFSSVSVAHLASVVNRTGLDAAYLLDNKFATAWEPDPIFTAPAIFTSTKYRLWLVCEASFPELHAEAAASLIVQDSRVTTVSLEVSPRNFDTILSSARVEYTITVKTTPAGSLSSLAMVTLGRHATASSGTGGFYESGWEVLPHPTPESVTKTQERTDTFGRDVWTFKTTLDWMVGGEDETHPVDVTMMFRAELPDFLSAEPATANVDARVAFMAGPDPLSPSVARNTEACTTRLVTDVPLVCVADRSDVTALDLDSVPHLPCAMHVTANDFTTTIAGLQTAVATDSAGVTFVSTPVPSVALPSGAAHVTSQFIVSVPAHRTGIQVKLNFAAVVTHMASQGDLDSSPGQVLFQLAFESRPGRHVVQVRALSNGVPAVMWERYEWTVDASTPTLELVRAPSENIPAQGPIEDFAIALRSVDNMAESPWWVELRVCLLGTTCLPWRTTRFVAADADREDAITATFYLDTIVTPTATARTHRIEARALDSAGHQTAVLEHMWTVVLTKESVPVLLAPVERTAFSLNAVTGILETRRAVTQLRAVVQGTDVTAVRFSLYMKLVPALTHASDVRWLLCGSLIEVGPLPAGGYVVYVVASSQGVPDVNVNSPEVEGFEFEVIQDNLREVGIPTADPLTTVTVRAEDVYGNAGKDLTLRLRYVNESDTVPYVLPSPHVISTSKTLSVDVAVVHAWGYAHFELEPVHPDPTEPARAGFGSLSRLRVPGQIGPVTGGRGTVSFTAGLLEGRYQLSYDVFGACAFQDLLSGRLDYFVDAFEQHLPAVEITVPGAPATIIAYHGDDVAVKVGAARVFHVTCNAYPHMCDNVTLGVDSALATTTVERDSNGNFKAVVRLLGEGWCASLSVATVLGADATFEAHVCTDVSEAEPHVFINEAANRVDGAGFNPVTPVPVTCMTPAGVTCYARMRVTSSNQEFASQFVALDVDEADPTTWQGHVSFTEGNIPNELAQWEGEDQRTCNVSVEVVDAHGNAAAARLWHQSPTMAMLYDFRVDLWTPELDAWIEFHEASGMANEPAVLPAIGGPDTVTLRVLAHDMFAPLPAGWSSSEATLSLVARRLPADGAVWSKQLLQTNDDVTRVTEAELLPGSTSLRIWDVQIAMDADTQVVIEVVATDEAGNENRTEVVIRRDGEAPEIVSVVPSRTPVHFAGQRVTVTASERLSSVLIDDAGVQLADNRRGFDFVLPALADGHNYVETVMVDLVGNTAIKPFRVTVDSVAPTLALVDDRPPVRGDVVVYRTATLEPLLLQASEPNCTFRVDLLGGTGNGTSTVASTVVHAGSRDTSSASLPLASLGITATSTDADVQYECVVHVWDDVGNKAAGTVSITLHVLAAPVTVTLPRIPMTGGTSSAVEAGCSRADCTLSVFFYTSNYDFIDSFTRTTIVPDDLETFNVPHEEAGLYIVLLVAIDLAGNAESTARLVTVDHATPKIGATLSATVINGDTTQLQVTCVDTFDGTHVKFDEAGSCECTAYRRIVNEGSCDMSDDGDGIPVPMQPSEAHWRWTGVATLTSLTAGIHTFSVTCTDAVGNTGIAAKSPGLLVDRTPPLSPVLSKVPPVFTTLLTATFQFAADPSEFEVPDAMSYVDAVLNVTHHYRLTQKPRGSRRRRVLAPSSSDWVATESPLHVSGLQVDMQYTMEIRSMDAAGNAGAAALHTWVTSPTPPSSTLLSHPPKLTSATRAAFVLSAALKDEPMHNVTYLTTVNSRSDLALDCCSQPLVRGDVGAIEVVCRQRLDGRCSVELVNLPLTPHTINFRTKADGAVEALGQAWTWEVANCGVGMVQSAAADGALVCTPCPAGGSCDGTDTSGEVVAAPAYWAKDQTSTFYECPMPKACLGGDREAASQGAAKGGNQTGVARCAPGYTGLLCAICEDGYFLQFGECAKCPETRGGAVLFTTSIALGALLAAGLAVLVVKRFDFAFHNMRGIMQVSVAFCQILASAATIYNIPWPSFVQRVLNSMQVFLLEVMKVSRLSCAQPMSFTANLVTTLVLFKAVLLCILLWTLLQQRKRLLTTDKLATAHLVAATRGNVTVRASRRRGSPAPHSPAPRVRGRGPPKLGDASPVRSARAGRVSAEGLSDFATTRKAAGRGASGLTLAAWLRRTDWGQVLKSLFQVLVLAYPGVSVSILKTFKCVEIEGNWYIQADLREQCFTPAWWALALYAGIMATVYTAGLPLLLTLWLRRYRHKLDSPKALAHVGFLYQTYGTHAYFWEVLELLRKLSLSSLLVYFEQGSNLQVTCAVVLCAWSAMLHGVYKPFVNRPTYYLQHAALQIVFALFVTGLLLKGGAVTTTSALGKTLSYLLIVLIGAYFAAAVALAIFRVVHNVRHERKLGRDAKASAAAKFKKGARMAAIVNTLAPQTANPLYVDQTPRGRHDGSPRSGGGGQGGDKRGTSTPDPGAGSGDTVGLLPGITPLHTSNPMFRRTTLAESSGATTGARGHAHRRRGRGRGAGRRISFAPKHTRMPAAAATTTVGGSGGARHDGKQAGAVPSAGIELAAVTPHVVAPMGHTSDAGSVPVAARVNRLPALESVAAGGDVTPAHEAAVPNAGAAQQRPPALASVASWRPRRDRSRPRPKRGGRGGKSTGKGALWR